MQLPNRTLQLPILTKQLPVLRKCPGTSVDLNLRLPGREGVILAVDGEEAIIGQLIDRIAQLNVRAAQLPIRVVQLIDGIEYLTVQIAQLTVARKCPGFTADLNRYLPGGEDVTPAVDAEHLRLTHSAAS